MSCLRQTIPGAVLNGSSARARSVPKLIMEAEGDDLCKVRRAELVARLAELVERIGEQRGGVKFMRQVGYSAALADERLKLLEDSRQRHLSALRELIGDQRG
jgi:hypothetical protein